MRPLGVQGERVLELHQQLSRMLARRTDDRRFALFLAEPRIEAGTGAISWHADSVGDVVAAASLDEGRKQTFDQEVAQIVTTIAKIVEDLESSGKSDQLVVAERLRTALLHPNEDDLYLVGDQPVLVNWGCEPASGSAPIDLISRVKKLAVLPRTSTSPPQVQASATASIPVGSAEEKTRSPLGWAWLGWLLALLVLLALALFLWMYNPSPLPVMGGDVSLLEEEIALHKERDQLRQRLFDQRQVCASVGCTGGRISGYKWEDSNGNGQRDDGEPPLAGVTVFIDSNGNGKLDAEEPRQQTDAQGQYAFTELAEGRYEVHEIVPENFIQTYPADRERPGDGLADVVLDFFDAGNGPMSGPYGSNGGPVKTRYKGKYNIESVTPDVVLQKPPPPPVVGSNKAVKWLALPEGSFVVVGFVDEKIIDGPGEDIFIQSFDKQDSADENANVFVSSDGKNFTFLGKINELGTVKLDLASIDFKQPVKAVKIVGLDNRGGSPGFDLISVRGLPGSVVIPGHHSVELKADGVVAGIDFGNQPVAKAEPAPEPEPKPEPAPTPEPKPKPVPKITSEPRPATEYCPEDKIIPPTLAMVYDNSGSMAFPLNMPESQLDGYWAKYKSDMALQVQRESLAMLGQLLLGRGGGVGSREFPSISNWVDKNLTNELRQYGPKRVNVAKPLMEKLIQETPESAELGLVAFSDCGDISKQFSGAGAARSPLLRLVRRLEPSGGTPIAKSLSVAGSMIDGTSADKPGIIVLVTDGAESCQADPCAVARKIKSSKPWAVVHVVKMGPEGSSNCVAKETGGKVYNPTSVDELAAAINEAKITAPFQLECAK